MLERVGIISIGFLLDLLFGDPYWLYHPVQAVGALIRVVENGLQRVFSFSLDREADKGKKRFAGGILVCVVLLCSVGTPALLLFAAKQIHPVLCFVLQCVMCYQMLAMKSLRVESKKVYTALKTGDIEKSRQAVSMIVGRDTEKLTEEGITKAAVETVAENTSDGVIAPLLFMLLFGVLGGFFYKAVNTMDSMVGYQNDRYCYLGSCAARLDDVLNFVPARVSAGAMLFASFLFRMNWKNAVKIFRRDRYCHASPNSAQTEAVCAGALSIQLAGDAYYFGILYHKPTIGDALRPVEAEDILRANRLLYGTSFLVWGAGVLCLLLARLLFGS
jgi:adenosylcobinamide-phosphate synthase